VIGQWLNKLAVAKDIMRTFASFQVGNNMGATKALGVDKKNIKKGCKRKLL
jgi:hypothetical protein